MNARNLLYRQVINQMGNVSELQIARELKYVYKQPGTLKEILDKVCLLKEKDKKSRPPKKYAEKEQLQRRKENHAAIIERDK